MGELHEFNVKAALESVKVDSPAGFVAKPGLCAENAKKVMQMSSESVYDSCNIGDVAFLIHNWCCVNLHFTKHTF